MIDNDTFLNISRKQLIYFNIFWIGFIVYTTSYVFGQSGHINLKICHALQLSGLIAIIPAAIHLIRFKFANKYLQIVFIFYCFWLLTVIVRGFSFNYLFVNKMLFDASFGLMPYLAPLILLFPKNLFSYKKVFDVIILLGILYIFYDVVFIKDLLNADRTSVISLGIVEYGSFLSLPVCFLLLTFPYHSIKRKMFSLVVILLTLLFAIIRARRGLIFICASTLIFSYLFYLAYSKNRFLIIASSIFLLAIGINFVKDIYLKKQANIFSFLIERGTEDTRTGIESYFYDDMKAKDWVYGRGIIGRYFCPGIDENNITGFRSVIETGYLQIILKGGLISLGLFLLIAIPAIIKGFFFSKNILSKAASIWIFLSLINLYPAFENIFILKHLLFWISIGICYSLTLRNIPETKMRLYFLSVKRRYMTKNRILNKILSN